MALGKLGMPHEGIAKAADLATRDAYPTPRPITVEGITALLQRAYYGLPPLTSL
jgi:maleylacetate reductase